MEQEQEQASPCFPKLPNSKLHRKDPCASTNLSKSVSPRPGWRASSSSFQPFQPASIPSPNEPTNQRAEKNDANLPSRPSPAAAPSIARPQAVQLSGKLEPTRGKPPKMNTAKMSNQPMFHPKPRLSHPPVHPPALSPSGALLLPKKETIGTGRDPHTFPFPSIFHFPNFPTRARHPAAAPHQPN